MESMLMCFFSEKRGSFRIELWTDWTLVSLSPVACCNSLFVCFHELAIIEVVGHNHAPLRPLNDWLFLLWKSSSVRKGRRNGGRRKIGRRGVFHHYTEQEKSVSFMVEAERSKLHIYPTIIFNQGHYGKGPLLYTALKYNPLTGKQVFRVSFSFFLSF